MNASSASLAHAATFLLTVAFLACGSEQNDEAAPAGENASGGAGGSIGGDAGAGGTNVAGAGGTSVAGAGHPGSAGDGAGGQSGPDPWVDPADQAAGLAYAGKEGDHWDVYDVAASPTTLVAVGDVRTLVGGKASYDPWPSLILRSVDGGFSWEGVSNPFKVPLRSVTHGNGRFLATGHAYVNGIGITNILLTSTDGADWQKIDNVVSGESPTVVYGNDTFLVTSDSGKAGVSADGLVWKPSELVGADSVAFGNGVFVARSGDKVLRSQDGSSWTKSDQSAGSLSFANGMFVTMATGAFLSSPDGVSWQKSPMSPAPQKGLPGFAGIDGRYIAFEEWGTVRASSDGKTWTPTKAGNALGVRTAGGALFVTAPNRILRSTTGLEFVVALDHVPTP